MIRKYSYGTPYETYATVLEMDTASEPIPYFSVEQTGEGLHFSLSLKEDEAIYGLGENVRGINKRGYLYISNNVDDAPETEGKHSLYSSHNFIIVAGKERTFGVFFDDPAWFSFDLGFSDPDMAVMTSRYGDLAVYIIEDDGLNAIAKEFRRLIGRSYLPPKWAFGFIQSRFGGISEESVNETLAEYEKLGIPIDSFCVDIDGLDEYQNFTWHKENFPDPERFVKEKLAQGIHLIPIVDVAIRKDENIPEYVSGAEEDVFCHNDQGEDFVGYVWPGTCVFPDYFQEKTRKWFGHCYQRYLNMGVHGFWNDMNEPAVFAEPEGFRRGAEKLNSICEEYSFLKFGELMEFQKILFDLEKAGDKFQHCIDGKRIPNERVHNLYGAMMTQGTNEGFLEYDPNMRFTLFTRSSYIGSHRYTGVWLGDNHSWWSHLLQNLKWIPSMNLCGYLYTGCDLGGFNGDTTDELMLRWLQLGVFVPLMRNHSAWGTRQQELWRFSYREKMAKMVNIRYALIPYLYSEFMKCALRDESMYRPLAFDYPDDERAKRVEDQIMLGGECMIAPVYEQNAKGRYIYLPEDMLMLRMRSVDDFEEVKLTKGDHYIDVDTDQLIFFIKRNAAIPMAKPAMRVTDIDPDTIRMHGWLDREYTYELYDDDGLSKNVDLETGIRHIKAGM